VTRPDSQERVDAYADKVAHAAAQEQVRGGACPACGGRSGDGTPACAYAGCPKRGGASVEVEHFSSVHCECYQRVERLTADHDHRKQLLADALEERRRLQASLAEAMSEIENYSAVIGDLRVELEQARAEVKCFVCTDWMKQADQLRADLAQARQDRDDADRDVETLQAIVKRQEVELAQKQKDIDYLLECQKDQLARADKLIDDLAQAREGLDKQRNGYSDALAVLGKQRDEARAERDQWKATCERNAAHAAESANKLDRWRLENDELSAELSQARATQENLLTGMETYLMEIRQLRAENQAMRGVVEAAEDYRRGWYDDITAESIYRERLFAALEGQAQPQ